MENTIHSLDLLVPRQKNYPSVSQEAGYLAAIVHYRVEIFKGNIVSSLGVIPYLKCSLMNYAIYGRGVEN